ncbi:MAG: DegT/DnrJ/EryC1/StrS family aminotransferase [Puniceicoccales bacterium]|jgi:dTDP-4-amino-4,6-dideoxygalactose transaminase|nr:DegT/DnrJ/EryC1/StrS family aminotransferase [Puniceicoccales bacterium]
MSSAQNVNVPLLDLAPQNGEIDAELTEAFRRVLHSCRYIMGPEVEAFERDTAALCQTRHGIGVSSGTDAILLALMALGVGPGDEVIVPAFTFFATAGCVARVGATPVWADVCPHSFNIDLADAAKKTGPRTKAIIPVHLFGQSADMDAVLAFASERGLRVIEDCAQSLGAKWHGRPVGSFGDLGAYSFFPSKNLGGFGDSGLLTANDDALAERARILRVHGMEPKYYHKFVGGNFRMDPLQAALLAVKLPRLAGYNSRRAAHAAAYHAALGALPGVASNTPDAPADALLLLPVDFSGEGIWNQFTLRVSGGAARRDSLRAHLAARSIGSDIYYPLSLDQQECFRGIGRGGETIRVAGRLGGEVLSIPVYPDLSAEQHAAVVAAIREWLELQTA